MGDNPFNNKDHDGMDDDFLERDEDFMDEFDEDFLEGIDEDFLDEMNAWLLESGAEKLTITPDFYSAYEEGMFTKCVDCGHSLLSPPCLYEIQKVFKGSDVIFEYAICMECGEKLVQEYSRKSIAALQKFFLENYAPSSKLDHCHLCMQNKENFKEYSLTAICHGEQMLSFFLVCHSCTEKMEELISEETRKSMGDFIEEKFPGVPAEFTPAPLLKI